MTSKFQRYADAWCSHGQGIWRSTWILNAISSGCGNVALSLQEAHFSYNQMS